MPAASALVVALASRMVMTIGDLLWAAVGLCVRRRRRDVTLAPEAAKYVHEPGT
jgi:hypothetical protein